MFGGSRQIDHLSIGRKQCLVAEKTLILLMMLLVINIRHQSRPDDDHYEDAIESKTLDSHSDIFRLFCLRNNGTCLQSLVVFKILSQAATMSES